MNNPFDIIDRRLCNIEVLLHDALNKPPVQTVPAEPELLTIDEASAFLRLAKPIIYSMVSRGRLPYMKRAKKLYFSKVQLMDYLKAGKVNPIEQTTPEALQNVMIKTKRGAR